MAKSWRRWRLPLAFLCGAGFVAVGWAWWMDRRYQSAMAEIESEMKAGQNAIACRNLNKLLTWRADTNGEIDYLLGTCELALGRNQAAGEAWSRVAPGSAFAEMAIRGRVYLFMNPGSLPSPSGSSTTSPEIAAAIGRPCRVARADLQGAGTER